MTAAFRELWSYSGVDDQRGKVAGMIVPADRGSNICRLVDGQNLEWAPKRSGVIIDELNQSAMRAEIALASAALSFGSPMGPVFGAALANLLIGSPRFFKITANGRIGYQGVTLTATKAGASTPEAAIKIVPLGVRPVNLAIRPVQQMDKNGTLVNHSKIPFDTKALCKDMNSIWTPQANVVFTLVSSKPAVITDKNMADFAKQYGYPGGTKDSLPAAVDIQAFTPLFKPFLAESPKANLTMFLVQKAKDGTGTPYGVTDTELGFSLIGDDRLYKTMAHEAGHWLGSFSGPAGWSTYGHAGPGLLMTDGEKDYQKTPKIPFDDTISYFNARY
jgi:hypothetical protein